MISARRTRALAVTLAAASLADDLSFVALADLPQVAH